MGEWKRVNWDKQPLGMKSDAEIARKLGITRSRVKKAREERDIKPAKRSRRYIQKGIDWDKEPLGDVPDKNLAIKHGVATVTVIMARKRRGIPSFSEKHPDKPMPPPPTQKGSKAKGAAKAKKPKRRGARVPNGVDKASKIDWDKEPLGKESDYSISKRLGVRNGIVRLERIKRGLPVAESSKKYAKRGIDWDAQPLGEIPDQEIADALGVKRNTVYVARKKRGIKLNPDIATKSRVDWDKEPLGKEPDKMLALMLGVSSSAVAKARNERGIPPYQPRFQQWVND